jgi:subtilase family serine protease
MIAALCALLCAALMAAATASAVSAAELTRVGARALLPAGTTLIGAVPPSTQVHITIALQPRDPAALQRYAGEVSQPGSQLYHRFLTTAEFRKRFGASAAAVSAVRSSLIARGLRPGALTAGGLSLHLRADAGSLERAFSVQLAQVRLPSGLAAIVNSLAPALDSRIAGYVQSVIGLSGLGALHPLLLHPTLHGAVSPARRHALATQHVATGGPQPCGTAVGAAPGQSAYTADQIASAYNFSGDYTAGNQGQGVTVALYELEPYDPQDIAAYQACYGTSAQVTNVSVDGGAGTGAGTGEAALDIEQLIGLAPKVNVIVYTGPNSASNAPGSGVFDTLQTIVNDNRAQVISMSWGQCEAMEGSADAHAERTLLEQAAIQGQTVASAVGDSGSEDCDAGMGLKNTSLSVDDPGSQLFVTGTGGTSLQTLGPPPGESVWNSGGNLQGLLGLANGAAGGGVSSLWPMPSYQSGAASSLGVIGPGSSGRPCGAGTGYCRQVPDVSANADPSTGYLIYYNGAGTVSGAPVGWQGTGGTSAAAPLWAALFALADASKGCAGGSIGFANPALYALASADYHRYFHDVTTGNNDLTGSHGGTYPAKAGYDMASGLGSPDAAQLTASLCGASLRFVNPGTISSPLGSAVNFKLRASQGTGGALSFTAHGLPPGLHLNSGTGIVSGKPRRAGTYTVQLLVGNPVTGSRASAFMWVISRAPRLSGLSLSGVGGGSPRLGFTVAAASSGPAIGRLSLTLPPGLGLGAGKVLSVSGSGGQRLPYSASSHGASIRISPRSPSAVVGVQLRLSASGGLRAQLRQGHHPKLRISVSSTDVSGGTSSLSTSVRPQS